MSNPSEFGVRPYQESDYEQICQLMEAFQQHLADLDSMGIVILDDDYGRRYTDLTLKNLVDDQGKMFVVFGNKDPGTLIGFGSGIAPEKNNPFHTLGHIDRKEGIITELFILKEFRGHGLGRRLVDELEKYFQSCGCDYSRIAVMTDNTGAYEAYKKMGYQNRTVELLKKIVV